jgi:hypothetical protein
MIWLELTNKENAKTFVNMEKVQAMSFCKERKLTLLNFPHDTFFEVQETPDEILTRIDELEFLQDTNPIEVKHN